MKLLLPLFFFVLLSFNHSFADETETIGITAKLPFIEVNHNGATIKIKRGSLQNNNIKTKPCPPFCIKPLIIAPNIETFAELEVIEFLNKDVKSEEGYLVDSRITENFERETIPGSINIPFVLFNNSQTSKVLSLLGAKQQGSSTDFSEVKTLCLFCNDPLCDESSRSIKALLDLGYPASKLKYYRGGIQAWKNLNLTTISPKE